jgi:cytochrome c
MKYVKILGLTSLLLTAGFLSGQALAGDAGAGKVVFRKCQTCHSIEEGQSRVGPSLYGVAGRTPGATAYRYSKAMTVFGESGAVWDEATLDVFLTSPRMLVKGTKMGFQGLSDAIQREDLIAYLKSVAKE